MTKIEIICGTYGYRPDGSKHPIPIDRGGICEVSEEEAQRLFALRVARPAEETPSPAVATPPAGEDGSGAGADPSNSGEGAEGAESAHLDPEQLKTLTNAKLTELAKEMGIDTAKLKTKAQLIAAIIYGFGEVVAGLVCLFIAFALLHILRDIVAVLFLLGLEIFKTALQLLQLVDDGLQILATNLIHRPYPPHSLLQSAPR